MSDFREEEALGKAYDGRLARRLLRYLRPYKWRVVFALVLTLAVTPLELVSPYLFKVGVDSYIVPVVEHRLARDVGMRGILWAAVAFIVTLLLSFTVQYVQIRVMQRVGQQTMYDLRGEIFRHLQRLPMSFYDRSPVGRLVTRVTTDVDALNELFAAGIVTMLNDFVLLVGIAVFLLWMKWQLALMAFSVLPLILLVTGLFRG
jgi:ATP-binding cassette subfamily B multidrug efflux pump